jgi:FkbM family methyltransferase
MAKMEISRLKQCRHGKMLYLWRDEYVGRSLDTYGEFSEGEVGMFEQIVKSNDVVIEVGANIGAHTVRLAQLVGEGGLVLAFEPQRPIYHMLCANLALNDIFNTHTYLAAVGSAPGVLQVPALDYSAEANFGGLTLLDATSGEVVPVTTLDSLTLPTLRLIKVDAEGMELDVLLGSRDLISKHRPYLYVENDRDDKSEAVIELLDEMGYDMWWHLPSLFNAHNFDTNATNVFGNVVSINMLCAPKEMALQFDSARKILDPKARWQER